MQHQSDSYLNNEYLFILLMEQLKSMDLYNATDWDNMSDIPKSVQTPPTQKKQCNVTM